MKVIGINGSARMDGNTALIIREVFSELEKNGIETELVQLAGLHIRLCRFCMGESCMACRGRQACVFRDDDFFGVYEKIKAAEGIILGSPVYGADITAIMRNFLDRMGMVSVLNPELLRHKVGAAVSAVRRCGGLTTVDALNHLMLFKEMIVVGSNYWNIVYGRDPGDVLNDSEGMENMRNLGQNMAWLLQRLYPAGRKAPHVSRRCRGARKRRPAPVPDGKKYFALNQKCP